jgi:3-oxoacyl-[acyl-carrier-protein] synthase-3
MGLDPDRVVININKYGNTTAATIPLAMSETYRANKLQKGDWVVLAAFGAGFTWGSILLRWAIDSIR